MFHCINVAMVILWTFFAPFCLPDSSAFDPLSILSLSFFPSLLFYFLFKYSLLKDIFSGSWYWEQSLSPTMHLVCTPHEILHIFTWAFGTWICILVFSFFIWTSVNYSPLKHICAYVYTHDPSHNKNILNLKTNCKKKWIPRGFLKILIY